MSRSNVNLLNLPDEILLLILKKLNNIDVLYSFIDANNDHLDSVAREKIFSDTLNFVSIDNVSAIDQQKPDRFCKVILPKIHENVKCFILEPLSMKRILLAAEYSNLTELKLFNFTNLKHLSIIEAHNRSYPSCDSPSISFSSATLSYLSINVSIFDDCLYLLDGRLKQLTTLIVQICKTSKSSSVIPITSNFPNLKCFSLTCYFLFDIYDEHILPLHHRFIDRSHLQNEILLYMPRLHSFTFYISTSDRAADLFRYVPRQDIQRIYANIGHEQYMANMINYISIDEA
ncbi:unnamed protein product, partial [Rotaria sp. Silwood1]